MVIIWSKSAKKDLHDFINNTHIQTKKKLVDYINNLVNYVDTLLISCELGKVLFHTNSLIVRQLLYKKHRIIYSVKDNQIIILAIVHISRDFDKFIKLLKENLS